MATPSSAEASSKAKTGSTEAEKPEPTVAFNPLSGFELEDLLSTAGIVVRQAINQPLLFTKHLTSMGSKLVSALAGGDKYVPGKYDRRFVDVAWKESLVYSRLLQTYFAFVETLTEYAEDLEFDEQDQLRARFLIQLIEDSIAPTNTLLGNPQALRKAWQTKGVSLQKGCINFLTDVRNNHGIPAQVKGDTFIVGGNLATTPGCVVFQNELMELIQYTPNTCQVYARPLLIVGAMINKFYALDLTPERSMIKYCTDNHLQSFVVSWANPQAEQSDWGVEKYAFALIEAINAIKSITDSEDVNVYALCSGAMTTSALTAYLYARGDTSIFSLTIAVCMLDMKSNDMEASAFLSDDLREKSIKRVQQDGILPGYKLARSMLLLRPKDLIWNNVVNNYLLGEDPPEFDLLYWNNDWTNLPAQLHTDFVNMYATSHLLQADKMELNGTKLNIGKIQCDTFFVGGTSDHITPWQACYRAACAFGGNKEFVLSNSGHIQTLINSPHKKRTSFYRNSRWSESASQWRETAQLQDGSWWAYWLPWVQSRSAEKKVAPETPGNASYPGGVAAPGEYVFQSSEG